jgi:hypothetical protein
MGAYKCIGPPADFVKAFTGNGDARTEDAAMVQRENEQMILSRQQMIATSFLAVLIVASVMSMPRAMDTPSRQARPANQASGNVVSFSTVHSELAPDQVRDLTYN